jgi:rhodanese-related sulfurtransferase/rubrerythrin
MAVETFTPDQLRRFIRENHEKTYLLVDVRQPVEYNTMHIPGAQLMPLPELVQKVDQLPDDKTLIFYCHSGGRSLAAASMTEEEIENHAPIYNLMGGIVAWDGATLDDSPRVRLFSGQGLPEMLTTAMNLEKGAFRFYNHVGDSRTQVSWSEVFVRLAKAETAHAQTVYRFFKQVRPDAEPFETLFERLDGDVLEGGMSLNQTMELLDGLTEQSCLRTLELALKIEYAAFDLYRNLADQSESSEAREAFISLAQAEKGHMHALIDAIEQCPA